MSAVQNCPHADTLRQLVEGTISDEDATELDQHLRDCPSCADQLRVLRAADTAHESLGTAADAVPSTRPGQISMPDRLGFLAPPAEVGELGWLAQYRILRVLGEGGMGMVLEAEDTHLQRRVALKVIRPEMAADPSLRQRFLREARAMAAIQHDHLVTIFQVGQDRDVPFLAMPYLQGETLQARLRRDRRLPVSEVVRIGREIAEGLAAAHAHGLIHRDIKPANIWLEAASGSRQSAIGQNEGDSRQPIAGGRAKLLDFGLALPTASGNRITEAGRAVGTPQYMAPEQARGWEVDQRCDLFSLGVVLYEMAAGVLPFDAADYVSILFAVTNDEPRPLAELRPDLPPALTNLVHHLLAKNPEERPASAADLVAALHAIKRGDQPAGLPQAARASQRPRRWLRRLGVGLAALLLLTGGVFFLTPHGHQAHEPGGATLAPPSGAPIRVGFLHSITGELAATESSIVDATLLAIDALNEKGGVLGRPVEAVLADGRSDEETFAREAARLISDEKVAAVFGCWTSACRKAVKPVFEKHNQLLFYPLYYEGLESSPNIVYTGGAPNQQIIPAVQWSYAFLAKRRFFLAGTDSVYPRTAHAIIRDKVRLLGGQIVGEAYVPPGKTDLHFLARRVAAAQPDIIVNSMNGGSSAAFIRALRKEGITPERVPMLVFNIGEDLLRSVGASDLAGDYTVASYFADLERPENHEFLGRLRAKLGPQRLATDPMESAYNSVHIWAKAVEAAGDVDPPAVAAAVRGVTLEAPGGPIRIDPDNQHVWAMVRLARIGADGRFEVVWSSDKPMRPEPYPATRTRAQWETFLGDLHQRWGGRWGAAAE